jgi:hypothetical protein
MYRKWKQHVESKLKIQINILIKDGLLVLESPFKKKAMIWGKFIRPHLTNHWQSEYNIPIDIRTKMDDLLRLIPHPDHGRRKEMTLRSKLPHLPSLVSNNFEVQALICSLFHRDMKVVHFGRQTHWKLKLLLNPLWFLFGDVFKPKDMFEVAGEDQSWHIVNAPNSEGQIGQRIPRSSHIDAGYNSIYEKGLPPEVPTHVLHDVSFEDRMMLMAFRQIAILFYCETPGYLGAKQGATAFIPRSHFWLLECVKRLALECGTLDWYKHSLALKEYGELHAWEFIPIELPEDKMLLSLGCVVHSPTWVTELMQSSECDPQIRTIQNCKITCNYEFSSDNNTLKRFLKAIPNDSYLKQLYCRSLPLCSKLFGEVSEEYKDAVDASKLYTTLYGN